MVVADKQSFGVCKGVHFQTHPSPLGSCSTRNVLWVFLFGGLLIKEAKILSRMLLNSTKILPSCYMSKYWPFFFFSTFTLLLPSFIPNFPNYWDFFVTYWSFILSPFRGKEFGICSLTVVHFISLFNVSNTKGMSSNVPLPLNSTEFPLCAIFFCHII